MKSSTYRLARRTTSGGVRFAAMSGDVTTTAIDRIAAAVLQSFKQTSKFPGGFSLPPKRRAANGSLSTHEELGLTVLTRCEDDGIVVASPAGGSRTARGLLRTMGNPLGRGQSGNRSWRRRWRFEAMNQAEIETLIKNIDARTKRIEQ